MMGSIRATTSFTAATQSYLIIVQKLDRVSRTLKDLLLTLEKIENTGADFHSITEKY